MAITVTQLHEEIVDMSYRLAEQAKIASQALTQLEHCKERRADLVRLNDNQSRQIKGLQDYIHQLETKLAQKGE